MMLSKSIRNFTFSYPNEIEFRELYEEIFKNGLYYVDFDTLSPKIIDCGAHIGLSVIYFKSVFPQAQITAFEPLPTLIPYLLQNIEQNQLDSVEVIEKAVWKEEGKIELFVDAETDNHWTSTTSVNEGAWRGDQATKPILVEAVLLSNYLNQPVDLLKIDIEGAETEVIRECQSKLKNVKNILIEFHANREHRPELLLKILQSSGFELTTYFEGKEISLDKLTRRKPTLYLIEGKR